MSMIRKLLAFLAVLAFSALSACGGGGGSSGTAPFGGGTGGGGTGGTPGASASDLVLVLSSATVGNSGTETVTATVTALDANRNALANVAVTLTADSDAVVTLTGTGATGVTGVNGIVTGTVSIGSNRTNRTITVTATAGSISKTASFAVVTASQPTPTAADISLALSAPSIPNSGTATVTATLTAVDSNRNAIAGIPVTMRVDSDATIVVSSQNTNASGVVTGTVSVGANRANRPITVTAVSGALTRQAVLQVVGTRIAATALPAVLTPATAGRVQYRVTDAANAPLTSFAIRIVGPGGIATNAVTDINGFYEYSYNAPAAAGNLEIRASSGGVDSVTTVIVQSGPGVIPPAAAGSVRSASVRANPSVVAVNATGSTENRSEIRALFVGSANQPIQNIRVRFDLDGDVNSIGGTLSTGTTLIYSDINGVAQSAYIPAARFSPTDGVTVRACWDYTDFAAGSCPNAGAVTTLTVVSDPLSVTVGTDNLVVVTDDLVYSQRFVVQVNDSSGLAKADVQVSPLLDLSSYAQGFWERPAAAEQWSQVVAAASCGNEDVNRNGVLEVYSNGNREDANSNGQLDPRKADVVVSFEGANRTDNTGRVILRITYPRNVGSWVNYALTVAATGVAGTEGRASFSGTLIVPIEVVQAEATPPFVNSPYGRSDGNPRVVVTTPDGRSRASLCSR